MPVLLLFGFVVALSAAGWFFRFELRPLAQEGMALYARLLPSKSKPIIDRFSADAETIDFGQSTQLVVAVRNATRITIEPLGSVKGEDRLTVHPAATTSYILTATGPGGSESRTVSITVRPMNGETPPPTGRIPVIASFMANPAEVQAGQPVTLSWQVSDTDRLSIDPDIGAVTGAEYQARPTRNTTYTLLAKGPGGSTTQTVSVTVTTRSKTTPPAATRPAIDSFICVPHAVERGQTVILSWSVRNATSVTIDQGVGGFTPIDQTAIRPEVTTTYTLVAQGPGGEARATVDVAVSIPPPPMPKTQPPQTLPQTPSPNQVLSGVFHCPNAPVPQGGIVVIDNLPNRPLRFDYDHSSWSALPIENLPNGAKRLTLISQKPGIQTSCEVKWETQN